MLKCTHYMRFVFSKFSQFLAGRFTIPKIASGLLLLTAFLPLVIARDVFYPEIFTKSLVFYGLVFLVSILFSLLLWTNSNFREQVKVRAQFLSRSKLAISFASFLLIVLLSSFLAKEPYTALWGSIDRGDGFILLLFFFVFVSLVLFLFKSKDWRNYFRLIVVSGFLTFLITLYDVIFLHIDRPAALIGNPIFLGSYFLFVITSALLVLRDVILREKTRRIENPEHFKRSLILIFWEILAGLTIAASVYGIFLTKTRGTLVGLVLAVIVSLIYIIIRAPERRQNIFGFFKIPLRRLAAGFLIVIVVAAGIFSVTRHAEFWQKIPGLDRLALISAKDPTTQSRLLNIKISLDSVNPVEEGIRPLLIGWGWSNYVFAWQKHYDPRIYSLDTKVLDHAHNFLLDLLVTVGVIGLLSYFVWWFFLLMSTSRQNFSNALIILFFLVAYFGQNLFAFDSIVTYLGLFSVFAYLLFLELEHYLDHLALNPQSNRIRPIILILISTAVLGLGIVYVYGSALPYRQTRAYAHYLDQGNLYLYTQNPSMLRPYTFVQKNTRYIYLKTLVLSLYPNMSSAERHDPEFLKFLDFNIAQVEEVVQKEPDYAYTQETLALAYEVKSEVTANKLTSDKHWLEVAAEYHQKALALMPGREEIIKNYALNLNRQGKNQEAIALLRQVNLSNNNIPEMHFYLAQLLVRQGSVDYNEALTEFEAALNLTEKNNPNRTLNSDTIVKYYREMMPYYFLQKDIPRFQIVLKRLIKVDPTQAKVLQDILDFIDKNGILPPINFN